MSYLWKPVAAAILFGLLMLPASAQKQKQSVDSWVKYASPSAGFSVEFPSEPEEATVEFTANARTYYGVGAGIESDRYAYLVVGVDFSREADVSLENLPDVLRPGDGGRVVYKKDISLGEFRGREYKIVSPRGTLVHRAYIARKWVYQLAVQASPGAFETERDKIKRFFASFVITDRQARRAPARGVSEPTGALAQWRAISPHRLWCSCHAPASSPEAFGRRRARRGRG